MCVSVCLSPTRSREWNVVSPRFFRQCKEILLASCTLCFSSLYDVWFDRKSLWNFSAGYALEAMHARYTSRLPCAGWILPTAWTPLEHSRRSRVPSLILLFTWTRSWLHNKKSTCSWTITTSSKIYRYLSKNIIRSCSTFWHFFLLMKFKYILIITITHMYVYTIHLLNWLP